MGVDIRKHHPLPPDAVMTSQDEIEAMTILLRHFTGGRQPLVYDDRYAASRDFEEIQRELAHKQNPPATSSAITHRTSREQREIPRDPKVFDQVVDVSGGRLEWYVRRITNLKSPTDKPERLYEVRVRLVGQDGKTLSCLEIDRSPNARQAIRNVDADFNADDFARLSDRSFYRQGQEYQYHPEMHGNLFVVPILTLGDPNGIPTVFRTFTRNDRDDYRRNTAYRIRSGASHTGSGLASYRR